MLSRGLFRYCPICDGYEVTDKRVGVSAAAAMEWREALFIRSYTADVTLIAPDKALQLKAEDRRKLEDAAWIASMVLPRRWRSPGDCITVDTAEGTSLRQHLSRARIGHLYSTRRRWPAPGCGRRLLLRDDHQPTSVQGLYAAGDVVHGLDETSHAMGQAELRQRRSGSTSARSARCGANRPRSSTKRRREAHGARHRHQAQHPSSRGHRASRKWVA